MSSNFRLAFLSPLPPPPHFHSHPFPLFPWQFICWINQIICPVELPKVWTFYDYIPVVLTGVCWKAWVYTFGISFSLEFCSPLTLLIKWVELDHLLEDLEQRLKLVPHVTHRPVLCCGHGLKYFKINCHQLNIVKFPIKVKIFVPFFLIKRSGHTEFRWWCPQV